jgi:hypothetical protein
MEMHQIRYFLAVSELLNFRRSRLARLGPPFGAQPSIFRHTQD